MEFSNKKERKLCCTTRRSEQFIWEFLNKICEKRKEKKRKEKKRKNERKKERKIRKRRKRKKVLKVNSKKLLLNKTKILPIQTLTYYENWTWSPALDPRPKIGIFFRKCNRNFQKFKLFTIWGV